MKRISLSILLGLCLGLSACSTVYEVRPQVLSEQVFVYDGNRESLRSIKKHVLELDVPRTVMRQFEDLRFMVSFTNRADKPIFFSSGNIEGNMSTRGVIHALSYETQLKDIENRLSYYYHPSYRLGVGVQLGHGYTGFNAGFHEQLDIQRACADLDHLKRFGLKPQEVRLGETVRGEVVFSSRLLEGGVQYLILTVSVDAEQHQFEFGYHEKR